MKGAGRVGLPSSQWPSFGAASLPGGPWMHNDQWEDSYFASVAYQSVRRGNFNSTNCIASFSGNGVGSCPILSVFLHKHLLGSGVNGCMAFAPYIYNYSYTLGTLPYQWAMSTAVYAQAWTDTVAGDVESGSGLPDSRWRDRPAAAPSRSSTRPRWRRLRG